MICPAQRDVPPGLLESSWLGLTLLCNPTFDFSRCAGAVLTSCIIGVILLATATALASPLQSVTTACLEYSE